MPRKADYSLMRCLYCGKELALLKRLTGGGEFCSEAHKQSYQEEYNRLALSRLLQAQKKGQPGGSSPSAAPPRKPTVAVEEPEPEVVAPPNGVAEAHEPVQQEPEAENGSGREEPREEAPEVAASVEPEPVESFGFIVESPSYAAAPPDSEPYVEAWVEPAADPEMSDWQLQNGSFTLSAADLLALDLRPNASRGPNASGAQDSPVATDVSSEAFTVAKPDAPRSAIYSGLVSVSPNRFPAGSAIAMDIATPSWTFAIDQALAQPVRFENAVLFEDPELLQLPGTSIDFPGTDSDVVVLPLPRTGVVAEHEMPPSVEEDDSPRASLDALSRLHQELSGQESGGTEETMAAPGGALAIEPVAPAEDLVSAAQAETSEPADVVSVSVAPEPADVLRVEFEHGDGAAPRGVPAVEPPPVEAPAVEQEVAAAADESKPKFVTELFEIALKTFSPAKPALIAGSGLRGASTPLLPQLKSLPLRPKVALAPDYLPSSAGTPEAKTADVKQAAPAAPAVRATVPAKPTPGGKPSARLAQPKRPTPASKAAQPAQQAGSTPATTKVSEPKQAAPAKTQQPAGPAPTQPAAKAPEKERKTAPSPEQAKPAAAAKSTATTEKPASESTAKPSTDARKAYADDTTAVPNFGVTQTTSTPWFASLKVKLGLAILIVVIACAYFFGWGGGKSSKPGASNPAVSTDGSGPSIIMGEGGWVEGWAGDPANVHAGRQITIYRPSLKLSDYRLEFQGTIDVKSLGWVFRAADPENYYAMKLTTVSSGLTPKVALYKYLVASGRQTQVGRVAIDTAAQPETVFNIRVDVRGPQFTTYIQGQQVDSWTDDQLKVGGAGFLNEREERGKVKLVSIRYLSGSGK